MLLQAIEAVPRLLGAYLTATGVFQLTLAQVSAARQKDFSGSCGYLSLIGGIVWTICVLMGVGFHFGSGGNIPLLPIFIFTLVFVHFDALLIYMIALPTLPALFTKNMAKAATALFSVLFALLGLAVHVATDAWLLRGLALTFTLLVIFMATLFVIDLGWAAASSALRRSDAGVDTVSYMLIHVCDTLLGVLFMFIAIWKYFGTGDRESREFTLTSTSILIAICLVDMCLFRLISNMAPALVHANRALSGVLLAFLECVTMTKHLEQYPPALGV